jgi:hypothetical protein
MKKGRKEKNTDKENKKIQKFLRVTRPTRER